MADRFKPGDKLPTGATFIGYTGDDTPMWEEPVPAPSGDRPDIDRHPATEPTATLYRLTDELPAKYRAEAIQAVRELVALARNERDEAMDGLTDDYRTMWTAAEARETRYHDLYKRESEERDKAEARAAELEAALRYADAVARVWIVGLLDGGDSLRVCAHPLSMVRSALAGETDPVQVGCKAEELDAALATNDCDDLRAALAGDGDGA